MGGCSVVGPKCQVHLLEVYDLCARYLTLICFTSIKRTGHHEVSGGLHPA